AKGVTDAKSAPEGESSGESSGKSSDESSEAESGEGAPPRDARLRAAVAAWVASAEDEAPEGADREKKKEEKDKGEEGSASPGEKSEQKSEQKAEGKAEGFDRPTAVFNTLRSKETERPEKPEKSEKPGGSEGAAGSKDDSDDLDDSDESPKDRQTTTLRKPVDRTTTTLRTLGPTVGKDSGKGSGADDNDGPKDNKDKGSAKPGAGAGSESDAERTSQFVPLRSTDAPAVKPAQAKPVPQPPVPPQPAAAPNAQAPAQSQAQPQAAAGQAAPQAMPQSERTTQQPLPPGEAPGGGQQMPLDLLAQLTNTPPPPETPTRTVVRRFKIWTPLVILLLIVFCVVQEVRPLPDASLSLGEKKAFTFGGEKFQMPWPDQGQAAAKVVGVGDIGTSGPQKPVPTASVAKAMTAHLILRDHPLKKGAKGPKITIDAQAEKEGKSQDESVEPVKEGEQYTEYQMLEMLLIPSANNVARKLARWDAGSEDAFVKKMNEESQRLGMTNTTYTDPSGFNSSTKSTAVDQTKLAEEAMKAPIFREIVGTPNVQNDPKLPRKLYNNNQLLMNYGTLGIKTGSSSPAGGALMWAAKRTIDHKEQLIVGATMDQHAPGVLDKSLQLAQTNTKPMIKAVQDALTSTVMVKKGDVVGYVNDGLGGKTPVVATKDLKGVGWPGLDAQLGIDSGGKAVPHSAKAGTVVGELTVGTGPSQQKVPVALQKELAEPSFGAKLTRFS
ncbi:D-alanyl-D-alanine carboxypeptidase family protein, partial [Streptomyces sp. NPDC057654]|uniref:D-alanyl-D-alanine carboxypeptidase family protein n=1 Tax=Streptomyces sp. NPDC057654 TaxID=3346196 RepID=UPI0036C74D3F